MKAGVPNSDAKASALIPPTENDPSRPSIMGDLRAARPSAWSSGRQWKEHRIGREQGERGACRVGDHGMRRWLLHLEQWAAVELEPIGRQPLGRQAEIAERSLSLAPLPEPRPG